MAKLKVKEQEKIVVDLAAELQKAEAELREAREREKTAKARMEAMKQEQENRQIETRVKEQAIEAKKQEIQAKKQEVMLNYYAKKHPSTAQAIDDISDDFIASIPADVRPLFTLPAPPAPAEESAEEKEEKPGPDTGQKAADPAAEKSAPGEDTYEMMQEKIIKLIKDDLGGSIPATLKNRDQIYKADDVYREKDPPKLQIILEDVERAIDQKSKPK